jgi:hypothetical protein
METHILFFVAAVAAGLINSMAGGGGLITFPLLALVLPPVVADATSAFATAEVRNRATLTLLALRTCLGAQPERGVGGLHGVSHHPHEVVVQRPQVRLIPQLRREGL